MEYTIKQVLDMTKISASAIRFYDKKGLLPFLNCAESGRRIFTEKRRESPLL